MSNLPPTMPQSLINLIGEYGFARTDGASEIERIHRWELLIDGIKLYAGSYAEEAVRLEREACELIAISWSDKSYEAEQIAEDIRARSQEGQG
jgi:hypothetical protein